MRTRQKLFLEELPKNKHVIKTSAIKAGYAPSYAHGQGKKILTGAIKAKAEEVLNKATETLPAKEGKRLMHELIGLTEGEVMGAMREIALNKKDYNSALKVLGAIARELGVSINEDQPKTIIPVLNIGLKSLEPPQIEAQNGAINNENKAS